MSLGKVSVRHTGYRTTISGERGRRGTGFPRRHTKPPLVQQQLRFPVRSGDVNISLRMPAANCVRVLELPPELRVPPPRSVTRRRGICLAAPGHGAVGLVVAMQGGRKCRGARFPGQSSWRARDGLGRLASKQPPLTTKQPPDHTLLLPPNTKSAARSCAGAATAMRSLTCY